MSHDDKPELGKDEFIHFEYLHFDPDDPGTGFSNMVDLAHTRTGAQEMAHKLLGDPRVWALHARRYEQPEQGVHLYDETQHLAKAQNIAFAERKRADTLQTLLGVALEKTYSQDSAFDAAVDSFEIAKAADDAVIMHLADMLEAIRKQASRDQQDAVFTEPGDIFRMAKLDLQALRDSERRKAKERAQRHLERTRRPSVAQETGEGENVPQEPAEARVCTKCGKDDAAHMMWAQRHLPAYAESTTDTPEDGTGLPDDKCTCGHARTHHVGTRSDGRVKGWCPSCRADGNEHHEFKLAVL